MRSVPDTAGSLLAGPTVPPEKSPRSSFVPWIVPLVLLAGAYGLLALTFSQQLSHAEVMSRCVLVNPNLARIWSVGNIEIGMAYLGVFASMLVYFLGIYRRSTIHLIDLALASGYLVVSFTLDYLCVLNMTPFRAMLIGDAVVMTFTLAVSRQIWFQRLLGVFVPLIFLTCGVGHFLEGASYWMLTYRVNVPWTMVTADIGFAILVNASRFPAFLRGEDILEELALERERNETLNAEIMARRAAEGDNSFLVDRLEAAIRRQRSLMAEMLASLTEGRLLLCATSDDLPAPLPTEGVGGVVSLTANALRAFRHRVAATCEGAPLPVDRMHDLVTAASEAAMNAIVHAGGGEGWIRSDPETGMVQVWIRDSGPGIPTESLHRATLERGFTTAGTLGHGFPMILETADRLWLLTGPTGTTVVLEQYQVRPEPAWLLRRDRAADAAHA